HQVFQSHAREHDCILWKSSFKQVIKRDHRGVLSVPARWQCTHPPLVVVEKVVVFEIEITLHGFDEFWPNVWIDIPAIEVALGLVDVVIRRVIDVEGYVDFTVVTLEISVDRVHDLALVDVFVHEIGHHKHLDGFLVTHFGAGGVKKMRMRPDFIAG
ncbi:hypothetical protein BC940DRAFT_63652, partial [Gongronella butleri]